MPTLRLGDIAHTVRAGVLTWVGLLAVAMCLNGCASTATPGASSDGPDDDQPPRDAVAREIEEADIIKYENGYFYLANRWTGLRIIDANTVERPQLAGRVSVQGRAVELFVRDETAFMLSSADFFYCAGEPVGFVDEADEPIIATPDYEGSRMTVADVSDKDNPAVIAQFDFDGFVSATRRVGDVLYAAGTLPEGYNLPDDDIDTNGDASTNGADDDSEPVYGFPRAFVVSINIADPSDPYVVETEVFYGDSFEINVSTQNAMFVAGPDPTLTETTLVTYVDISDPAGDIRRRDQFRVPGVIDNRHFMDEYDGTFRIIAEEFPRSFPTIWTVALYVYDISDPDDIDRLARLTLVDNQGMRSVRFDGPLAYAATENLSDPLMVLDLNDPDNPTIAGQLHAVGVSTHLVPLGDRLLSMGADSGYPQRPSITLFDVSDPTEPQPMSRIVLGSRGDRVASAANFDDKAVQVLEDEQLILIPFTAYDDDTLEFIDGVQMVDLEPTRLRERGEVLHRGLVRRSGVLDERLWVLSDEAFKVADIDDRDEPNDLDDLDFISDQELLDLGLWECVATVRMEELYDDYYWHGHWGGGVFCGAGAPAAVLLTGLGLAGIGWSRRRHR